MTDLIRAELAREPNKDWLANLHQGSRLLSDGIAEIRHLARIMHAAGNDRISGQLFEAAESLEAAEKHVRQGTYDAVHDAAVSAERATATMMAGVLAMAFKPAA